LKSKYLKSFTLYNNYNSSVTNKHNSKNQNHYNFLNIKTKSINNLNEHKSIKKINQQNKKMSNLDWNNRNNQLISQDNIYNIRFNNEKNGCYANVSVQILLICENLFKKVLIFI